VVWAWEDDGQGRIPVGGLVLAAGREGTGKSSFAIWLAAAVTRGTLPGAWHGRPRSVVLVAVEDSWQYQIVPRLTAAGADLDRIIHVTVAVDDQVGEQNLCLPVDVRLLEQVIADHDVALIVLDPLLSAVDSRLNAKDVQDIRTALEPLQQMADRAGVALLGIAHFKKGAFTDASEMISGSHGQKDVARCVFGFAADRDTGEAVITQTKNSWGLPSLPSMAYRIDTAEVATADGHTEVARFVMLGPSERTIDDIAATADPEENADRREAADWLREFLLDNGGNAWVEDVFKAGAKAGFKEHTLRRARTRAGVIIPPTRDGMKGAWLWMLKDQPAPIAPADQHDQDDVDDNVTRVSAASSTPSPSPRQTARRPTRRGQPDGQDGTFPTRVTLSSTSSWSPSPGTRPDAGTDRSHRAARSGGAL
jgi:hypothetical protein